MRLTYLFFCQSTQLCSRTVYVAHFAEASAPVRAVWYLGPDADLAKHSLIFRTGGPFQKGLRLVIS